MFSIVVQNSNHDDTLTTVKKNSENKKILGDYVFLIIVKNELL